jgi:hypothetical protein
LLLLRQVENPGVPIYDQRLNRKKQGNLQIGPWKDDEWPPERIIQYYGPATWAEDGSWGYHTPIYMLNRIIRLQTVVEIITNETARTLNLLAKQSTQMHNAIYQNHLALDNLLASEGRICGKFNLSNCCLQIDDERKAKEEITEGMTNLAHIPVQTWKEWDPNNLFGGWFSAIGGFKTLVGAVGLILGAWILLACFLPLVTRSIRSRYRGYYRKKNGCTCNDGMETQTLKPGKWSSTLDASRIIRGAQQTEFPLDATTIFSAYQQLALSANEPKETICLCSRVIHKFPNSSQTPPLLKMTPLSTKQLDLSAPIIPTKG